MTQSDHRKQTEQPFLSVDDAEIVHGPDVIAEKVSAALKDADRFDVPEVKPPLSKALDEAERAGRTGGGNVESGPDGQNALAVKPADVDERAGSAELLKPGAELEP